MPMQPNAAAEYVFLLLMDQNQVQVIYFVTVIVNVSNQISL